MTIDRGRTWRAVELPSPNDEPELFHNALRLCEAANLLFWNPRSGIVRLSCRWGESSQLGSWVYVTDDGGETWIARRVPSSLGNSYFANPNVGWWLSDNVQPDTAEHLLYRTENGGETWKLIKKLAWKGQFNFVSEHEGWAVAIANEAVALVHTTDGGRIWEELIPQIVP